MSKRKKPEEVDDENENETQVQVQSRPQTAQKVYDFHKKTIEVYPERLRELNRQFSASIATQLTSEPYSVLVGNCLDYLKQYFSYEDDFLQYSPWLSTRLKQSRSEIVSCLQDTIDLYEALARNEFDHLFEKSSTINKKMDDILTTNNSSNSIQKATEQTPSFSLNFKQSNQTTPLTSLNFQTPTATDSVPKSSSITTPTTKSSESTPIISFGVQTPKNTEATTIPTTGFTFQPPKSTAETTTSSFSFQTSKPAGSTSETTTSPGFTFQPPQSTSTTSSSLFNFKAGGNDSPSKTATSPFSFTLPTTGFGTSTFSSDKTTSAFGTGTTTLSFNPIAPTNVAPSEGADDDNEPSEPPQAEKVVHETDAKLTYNCRMGVTKSGKLTKRGPVQVVIKANNEKSQMIVRSDDSLGRLFLNIIWSKMIELKKNGTKDLSFVCQLNPGMTEIKEGEFVTILFRFENETDRNDAFEKFEKERS